MRGRKRSWTTTSGAVLTDADAARLAKEFEDSDELPDAERVKFPRRSGRPSLSGEAAVSPQVTFRLPSELRTAAETVAARQGRTVSQLAREALEENVHRSLQGKALAPGASSGTYVPVTIEVYREPDEPSGQGPHYRWRLLMSGSKLILTSGERYESEDAALKAIEDVRDAFTSGVDRLHVVHH